MTNWPDLRYFTALMQVAWHTISRGMCDQHFHHHVTWCHSLCLFNSSFSPPTVSAVASGCVQTEVQGQEKSEVEGAGLWLRYYLHKFTVGMVGHGKKEWSIWNCAPQWVMARVKLELECWVMDAQNIWWHRWFFTRENDQENGFVLIIYQCDLNDIGGPLYAKNSAVFQSVSMKPFLFYFTTSVN